MRSCGRLVAPHALGRAASTAAIDTSPKKAIEYCVSYVRQYDYEGYLCTLALPPAARAPSFAVRAFNVETARVLDSAKEKPLQLMRLRWWRDALGDTLPSELSADSSGAGQPKRRSGVVNPSVAGHPVLQALTASTAGLPPPSVAQLRACLERLTLAREADAGLESVPPSLEALLSYAQAAGGSVLEAVMHCTPGALDSRAHSLGDDACAALDAARRVGTSVCLAALLAGTRHHLAAGRVYLPADVLADTALQLDSLRTEGSSEAAREAFAAVAAVAQTQLAAARALRGSMTPAAARVLLPATPAGLYLDALQKEGNNALADALARPGGVVSPISLQARLAWAAWRGTF